jgi:hypothetical protein
MCDDDQPLVAELISNDIERYLTRQEVNRIKRPIRERARSGGIKEADLLGRVGIRIEDMSAKKLTSPVTAARVGRFLKPQRLQQLRLEGTIAREDHLAFEETAREIALAVLGRKPRSAVCMTQEEALKKAQGGLSEYQKNLWTAADLNLDRSCAFFQGTEIPPSAPSLSLVIDASSLEAERLTQRGMVRAGLATAEWVLSLLAKFIPISRDQWKVLVGALKRCAYTIRHAGDLDRAIKLGQNAWVRAKEHKVVISGLPALRGLARAYMLRFLESGGDQFYKQASLDALEEGLRILGRISSGEPGYDEFLFFHFDLVQHLTVAQQFAEARDTWVKLAAEHLQRQSPENQFIGILSKIPGVEATYWWACEEWDRMVHQADMAGSDPRLKHYPVRQRRIQQQGWHAKQAERNFQAMSYAVFRIDPTVSALGT